MKKSKQKSENKPPKKDEEWQAYLAGLSPKASLAAHHLFDEMDDRLGKSIGVLQDTQQVGEQASGDLTQQGEQLRHIEHDLNQIRRNQQTQRKQLNLIQSFFGKLWNKLTGCCYPTIKDEHDPSPHKTVRFKEPTSPELDPVSTETPLYDRYQREEKALGTVHDLIDNLSHISEDIHKELLYQDQVINRLMKNGESALKEMRRLNDKATSLLQ